MRQLRNSNLILAFLFVVLTTCSGLAQEPKEPFQAAWEQANLALRRSDFDTAVKLYSQAISLFPKIDSFTPKNKMLKLADGRKIESPYYGLESLYFGRAQAYLRKREPEQAENDFASSLMVLKVEIAKRIDKAKTQRSNVNLKKEKESPYNSLDNSDLAKTAFSYSGALQTSDKASYFNGKRRRYYQELNIPLPQDKQDIGVFNEIVKLREDAFFGTAEAYTTLMLEVGNKNYAFLALKWLNEFIAAFPNNVKAYELRAKVHAQIGNREYALADQKKINELTPQK